MACLLGLSGCDDQQYVSPDTFALSVTDEGSGVERVHRCHYVPVLLGSRIQFRYRVDTGVSVTLSVTRDEVEVTFEGAGFADSASVSPKQVVEAGTTTIDWAPPGYSAELIAGCTPDDEYEP